MSGHELRPSERRVAEACERIGCMTLLPIQSPRSREFLIVEPDPLFRLLLCVAASGHFSDFYAVGTLGEAQSLLSTKRFAAVIAERHLPGGSALDLYAQTRRMTPEAAFVLMCGGESIAIDDPQFRFFAKPFCLTEFTNSLVGMIPATAPD